MSEANHAAESEAASLAQMTIQPTAVERQYMARGLTQPGGKLPLFDDDGRPVNPFLVRACLAKGWVAPWLVNPLKPDWLVCKLTDKGRSALAEG